MDASTRTPATEAFAAARLLDSMPNRMDDFLELVAKSKLLTATENLEESVGALAKWKPTNPVKIDLAFFPSASKTQREEVLRWISSTLTTGMLEQTSNEFLISESFAVRLCELEEPPVNLAGVPAPSLLIAAGDTSADMELLQRAMDDHPAVIFVARAADSAAHVMPSPVQNLSVLDWQNKKCLCLKAWILSKGNCFSELLGRISLSKALRSGTTIVKKILGQEIMDVQTDLSLASAELSQWQAAPGLGLDLNAKSQLVLQRRWESFYRKTDRTWAELISPQSGHVWKVVEEELKSLKVNWIPRARSDVAEVPAEFREQLLTLVWDCTWSQCEQDLSGLTGMWKLVGLDMTQAGIKSEMPLLGMREEFVDEGACRQMLAGSLQFQRKFQSEHARRGPTEFLMHANQFVMPLVIIAMRLGLTGFNSKCVESTDPNSFACGYPHAARYIGMAKDALNYVVPILLVVGGIVTWRTVRRERAETESDEAKKAADFIRDEVRRILPALKQAWLTRLQDSFNDNRSKMLAQLEVQAKTQSEKSNMQRAVKSQELQGSVRRLTERERELSQLREQSGRLLKTLEGDVTKLSEMCLSLLSLSA